MQMAACRCRLASHRPTPRRVGGKPEERRSVRAQDLSLALCITKDCQIAFAEFNTGIVEQYMAANRAEVCAKHRHGRTCAHCSSYDITLGVDKLEIHIARLAA